MNKKDKMNEKVDTFEKNIFLYENGVVRLHLPNGKVIIVSCNEEQDVKLVCEDKEFKIQGGIGVLQKN
jgi:hypothetical protein